MSHDNHPDLQDNAVNQADKNKSKSKFNWRLPIAALLLVALGVLVGLGIGRSDKSDENAQNTASTKNAKDTNGAPNVTMAVEAITPSTISVESGIDANGLIAARQTAQVSGRISGAVVERVLVEVGDKVQAGQVLAVLDASSLKDSHTQALADLDQAIASAEKAHADLARTEPLLALDAISRQQVDAYRTAAKQADATVVAARAKANNTKTSLNNANITAPVSGVISERNAQVGVLASGSSLFTIIKDGALEWQATLAPDNAAKIGIGQVAIVNVGDNQVAGKVTRLSPTANQGREIIAHVALPIGTPLAAGMYQTGKFILSQDNSLAVPKSALTTTDGYNYVWTLQPKDAANGLYQVARTKVDVVSYQGENVAIKGISPDVLMVARSVEFLSVNDIVKVASVNDGNVNNNNDSSANANQDIINQDNSNQSAQGQ